MYFGDGAVGEVVNTLVCGTSMREFDSHMAPQFKSKRTCKKVLFMLLCMQQEILHKIKMGTFSFAS